MIVLWGSRDDAPLAAVWRSLSKKGLTSYFLDHNDSTQTDIELCVGKRLSCRMTQPQLNLDLTSATGFYLRPVQYTPDQNEIEQSAGDEALNRAHRLEDILLTWADICPGTVLNRPSAMASNGSKPFQAKIIMQHGFKTPRSLYTTSREALKEFWRVERDVIYKSVSGVRSIVCRLTDDHLQRIDDLSTCPVQLQTLVNGEDVRVHVIGKELFATRIISGATDYRYAGREGHDVNMEPLVLPEDVASNCQSLAAAMKLDLAGIDLRHSAEGDWYCFEVNPSPGFTYYENFTGQAIADAIAYYLHKGNQRGDAKC